jgi:trehalose 6-phosphate phosphatase
MPDLPSALASWPEIERRLAGRRLAVFLDYDGTLSPIVSRPELALLPPATRDVLARLARRFPVAVLSGRDREDVAALVGMAELTYAGSHGFDIAGPPPAPGAPPLRHEAGEGIPAVIAAAAARLAAELAGLEGVLVEPKRFAVAVHYRLAIPRDLPRIERAVDQAAAAFPALRKTGGKKVFELRPAVDWHKGAALHWLLDGLQGGRRAARRAGGPDTAEPWLPIYLGDDVTDEDAFAAVAARGGIGILVAEQPRPTAASYLLRDPEEVRLFLEQLAGLARLPGGRG